MIPESIVYRNLVYYLIGSSSTKVWFEDHGSRNSVYRVIGECSVAAWCAGNPFSTEL